MNKNHNYNPDAIPVPEQGTASYKGIHQLYKNIPNVSNHEHIFPVTYTQSVYDGKTGASLEHILHQFNHIFLQFQGTAQATRNLLPKDMRRKGIMISYRDMSDTVITEKNVNEVGSTQDEFWGLDSNWARIDELSLSGDISVSAKGTWIINGEDTGINAVGPQGDKGISPLLRINDDKLEYSYDGNTWLNLSDYLTSHFRVQDNKLQISRDNQKTWQNISDYISAWFRWYSEEHDTAGNELGKIQISRDNGTSWSDLSSYFTNSLHIKGYVSVIRELPSSAALGDIYGVGPTYDTSDAEHTNPIYRLYVKTDSGWVDNGQFTSISAGVVQELGDSETEVMSQKAITEKINELERFVFGGEAYFDETDNKFVLVNALEIREENGKSYRIEPQAIDFDINSFEDSTEGLLLFDIELNTVIFKPYTYKKTSKQVLFGVVRTDTKKVIYVIWSSIKLTVHKETIERTTISSPSMVYSGGDININTVDKQIEVNGSLIIYTEGHQYKTISKGTTFNFAEEFTQGRVFCLVYNRISDKLDLVPYNKLSLSYLKIASILYSQDTDMCEYNIGFSSVNIKLDGLNTKFFNTELSNLAIDIDLYFGKYISKNKGELVDNYTRYFYTDYIPVNVGDIIFYQGYMGILGDNIVAYDNEKNKIKALSEGDETVKILSLCINDGNIKYIRASADSNYEQRFVKILRKNPAYNNKLYGKKISIIGDSISTMYGKNAVSFTVNQSDIDEARTLIGYPTSQDVGKTIGTKTISNEDLGKSIEFTPIEGDFGKQIGVPVNYNGSSIYPWWYLLERDTGCSCKAVCWSGSSMTSHEDSNNYYKGSYAWHPSQIEKLAHIDEETRISSDPDIIIIYRGTNDFSHTPYAKLTDFCNTLSPIPDTDVLEDGGYGFKEAYCITIKKIREKYPNVRIYCCTLNIFKRISYSHYPVNNKEVTLPQYNDAIREVANYMGCGLIEFDKDGITFENCYPTYISDSETIPTHPNMNGHSLMYQKAKEDLNL